jgi:hypothetical protein
VSNIKLKVEEMTSDQVATALSRPLNFSWNEWYWQQTPITPSAQSIVVEIPNNFRWVSHVIAVLRKVTDITSTTSQNKLKFFTADQTEVVKANLRYQGQLRYPEPLSSALDMMYELKKLECSVEECDYFQSVITNATSHSVYAFRVGRSISKGVESGVNCSSFTAPTQIEITWTSALQATNYVMDVFTIHTRYLSIGGGGFSIAE